MPFNCPSCSAVIEDYIPKKRMDEVIRDNNDMKEALSAVRMEADAAKTAAARLPELEDLYKKEQEKAGKLMTDYRRDIALTEAGIRHPDVREVFAMHFEKQKEITDPAEWLSGLIAEPSKMPTALSMLYAASHGANQIAPQATAPIAQAPAATPRPLPPSNLGAVPQAAPSLSMTASMLKTLSGEAKLAAYEAAEAQFPQFKGITADYLKSMEALKK